MDRLVINPFAALFDFNQVASAVAASAQLNRLASRQYRPLDRPAPARNAAAAEMAAFDRVVDGDPDSGGDDDHPASVAAPCVKAADAGLVAAPQRPVAAPTSRRFDFGEAFPDLVVGTGPRQRFG